MKVIEVSKRYTTNKTEFPIKETCEHCGSIIELDEMDLSLGKYGAMWYRCPVCKRKCIADNVEGIELTKDNIIFPDYFNHSIDGVDLDGKDIKEYIKEGIEYFRKNPDAFTFVTGSGNTGVMVQNYSGDEEYLVVVTKDYYDMNIPYEDEDYAAQDENGWKWNNDGVNLKRQKVKDD